MTRLIVLALLALLLLPTTAQGEVAVPDLDGLTVPQAAAALNAAGLRLGTEQTEEWRQGSDISPNTIIGQTPAAGEPLAPGAAVDVTVLRPYTARFFYDNNDFTILNRAREDIRIHSLELRALGDDAVFQGTRWEGDPTISPRRCAQVWSVSGIAAAKDVQGCGGFRLIRWMTTMDEAEHFWTGDDGSTGFEVVQDGIVRGTCDTSDLIPGTSRTCDMYIGPGTVADDITEYVYFTYNSDYLLVVNRSPDRWMPTSEIAVAGALVLGDPANFDTDAAIGDVGQLAPGQCLQFAIETPDPETPVPEDCTVIASTTLPPNAVFWTTPFDIVRVYEESAQECPAVVDDQRMICLLPR